MCRPGAELVFCAFKGPHGSNAGCEPTEPSLRLKSGRIEEQVKVVASPRYHRWRGFLLREKFENRARLEVKAFVVADGKDLNSRIGLYAQRRLDLMRRPLGRPSAPP